MCGCPVSSTEPHRTAFVLWSEFGGLYLRGSVSGFPIVSTDRLSVLLSTAQCLGHCGFIESLEIGWQWSVTFVLPLQCCVGWFGSPYESKGPLVHLHRVIRWGLIGIALNLQIKLGRTDPR